MTTISDSWDDSGDEYESHINDEIAIKRRQIQAKVEDDDLQISAETFNVGNIVTAKSELGAVTAQNIAQYYQYLANFAKTEDIDLDVINKVTINLKTIYNKKLANKVEPVEMQKKFKIKSQCTKLIKQSKKELEEINNEKFGRAAFTDVEKYENLYGDIEDNY